MTDRMYQSQPIKIVKITMKLEIALDNLTVIIRTVTFLYNG